MVDRRGYRQRQRQTATAVSPSAGTSDAASPAGPAHTAANTAPFEPFGESVTHMRSLRVVFALLLVGCTSSPTEPGASSLLRDGMVVLQVGASAQVNSDLRVSFAEVVEDSRCPASVVCAWQGNGAIRLEFTTGRGVKSAKLNTAGGTNFPREATVDGYTFELVELEPQPKTPDPIPAQQYRAAIRVTRTP